MEPHEENIDFPVRSNLVGALLDNLSALYNGNDARVPNSAKAMRHNDTRNGLAHAGAVFLNGTQYLGLRVHVKG
jgi:hypothetical protein